MSANRHDLITQMNTASCELLREKGYISFADLLIQTGKLTPRGKSCGTLLVEKQVE
jgi:hypothetical protein